MILSRIGPIQQTIIILKTFNPRKDENILNLHTVHDIAAIYAASKVAAAVSAACA